MTQLAVVSIQAAWLYGLQVKQRMARLMRLRPLYNAIIQGSKC
jgi:hypothetical protein